VLSHTAAAIDLSRAPLPLIECHDTRKVNIGIIENVRISNGTLKGDARFGESARASELLADIQAGIVTGLSIGYQITDYTESGDTLLATRWQPYEVSIVSTPADIKAGFNRSLTVNNEENAVSEINTRVSAERTRAAEILQIADLQSVRSLPGIANDARLAVETGQDPHLFRQQVLERLTSEPAVDHRSMTDEMQGINHFTGGRTFQTRALADEDVTAAMADALAMRSGITVKNPHAATRDFANMSVVDMARTLASRRGQPTSRITRNTLFTRGSGATTSDFVSLLSNSLNKSVTHALEELESNWKAWTRQITVADFKPASLIGVGAFSGLNLVPESGEYQQGSMIDSAESIQIATYGANFGLTRQALVNDDLGQFGALSRKFAAAANRKIAELVYGRLVANPTLAQDSKAVFHTDHSNLVTGVKPPSVANIAAATATMRMQKSLGGHGYLNLQPTYLLAPVGLELTAKTVIASGWYPDTAVPGNVVASPLMNSLTVLTDPLLDANSAVAWYLAANPMQHDTVIVAFLDGAQGISIETFAPDEKSDTTWWKVRLDCAATVADYRGLHKHVGS